MTSIFLPIDVQAAWAPKNEKTTAALAAAADQIREQMQIMWVMLNMGPASRQSPYRANEECLKNAFYKFAGHNPLAVKPSAIKDIVVGKGADDLARNPVVIPFLKRNDVDTVYLAGFETAKCVWKSAQSLTPHFNVVLFSDLTADNDDKINEGYEQKFKDIGVEITSFADYKKNQSLRA